MTSVEQFVSEHYVILSELLTYIGAFLIISSMYMLLKLLLLICSLGARFIAKIF